MKKFFLSGGLEGKSMVVICDKCGRKVEEGVRCDCEIEKKGFIKRGAAKLLGVLKKERE